MAKTYRIAIPLMLVWLLGWIVLSWPAIQDDALIHLRYADNLARYHSITYDGVHHDYGASSLLYVSLLAALRVASASANLARGVSSAVHLLLFAGLVWVFWFRSAGWELTARLAALTLLMLVVMPGAVRWLDDGMETGLVVSVASLLASLVHEEYCRIVASDAAFRRRRFAGMVVLGFLTVLLRTELALLCGVGSLLLVWTRATKAAGGRDAVGASLHLLLGALGAVALIYATMHSLLPDTAKAKSLGITHWFNPIHDAAVTLAGAMSFGEGMLLFWLLTLALLVIRLRRISPATALANCLFPVVLGLASLRGQEIQGARYFAWTFFFAVVWNILELGNYGELSQQRIEGRWLLYGFVALLLVELPFEAVAMRRVLTRRAASMHGFEAQHLDVLRNKRGVASDIGYIGYFTGAKLCDLAGLVNGRAAASLTSRQRAEACAASDPDFLFLNAGQLGSVSRYRDFSQWKVCGQYDFTNVTTPDSHYLMMRPEFAPEVCRATGWVATPLYAVISPQKVER